MEKSTSFEGNPPPREAQKAFQEMGFHIEITQDGSPSLRLMDPLLRDEDGALIPGESMHHSGGAYSETDLIYGQPLRQILDRFQRGNFLIVGLGLGYIEMMVAKEALLRQISPSKISLLSFESVPELRDAFLQWVYGEFSSTNYIYDQIANFCRKETALGVRDIPNYLKEIYESGSVVAGALNETMNFTDRYEGLFYDAFSAKTTPLLWDEDFLVQFLERASSQEYALLSTYACRGSLKRALHRSGFTVNVREGFKGKRNSTWGLRHQKASCSRGLP